MYCPECNVKRPQSHLYCFDCASLLKDDHQDEHLWATIDFASRVPRKSFFDEIEKYAEQHPENPFVQKVYANGLFRKGKLIEAESRYRAALDIEPNDIDLLYDLCIVLYYQAKLTEALSELKKLLNAAPDYSAAHYRIGLTYYHLGQFDDAVKHFQTCATLTPDYHMSHCYIVFNQTIKQ